MRRVMTRASQLGVTLIELMVGLAIMATLALAAAPYFSDYGINARLRESGNTLYAEAMYAQSEAIKRNRTVQLATSGNTITVSDITISASPVTLRTRTLGDGVTAATASIAFASQGMTTPLQAVAINLAYSGVTCSDTFRCPGLRVEAGGAVRLCGNQLAGCS